MFWGKVLSSSSLPQNISHTTELHHLFTAHTALHYMKLLLCWTTLHYSEQSILTLAPTFHRKLLLPSPRGKGTSRHRNKRTGARAVSEAMGDSGLKNENRQENFLRWEEGAPSRTFLEETPIVALKVSLFKVFTKRSSFRCRPWQIIFCKAVFTVPWVTPAWYTQLPFPTGHLSHTYPHHNQSHFYPEDRARKFNTAVITYQTM